MDYSKLIGRAGRVAWCHKFLWLFGLLAVLGNVVASLVVRFFLRPANLALPEQPDELFYLYQRLTQPGPLIGTVLILFVGGLAVWLVSAIAEGGLIRAAVQLDNGRQFTPKETWQNGRRLLWRFIVIDTLLFLPLFLLTLILMLLLSGALIGAIVAAGQGAALNDIWPPLAVVFLCAGLLLLLMLPVGLATILFRLLSFRATALQELKAMASIRQAWQMLRSNFLPVLIVAALTWGLRYLLSALVAAILFPFSLVTTFLPSIAGWGITVSYLITGVTLGIALFHGLLQAAFHAFFSTVWTFAYEELAQSREG